MTVVAALAGLLFGMAGGVVFAQPASAALVVNGCTIVENPTPTNRTNCPNRNLSGANLADLNLSYANFSGSNLKGADLSNSNLAQANLSSANLKGARLGGANLSGANVRGANLQAFFAATVMPNGSINSTGSTIALSPATATIPNGLTQAFTATASYSDGTSVVLKHNVTWSSSNTQVATVSSTGIAKGVVPNAPYNMANFPKVATITATAGSASGNASLTVGPPNLASIAVTPATPAIVVGNAQQFAATGTYSDASATPLAGVTWASNTPAVATIDTAGLATGVAAGTTTIGASSGTISGSTTLKVVDPLTITTASPLPVGVDDSAYAQTLAAAGGVGPYSWSKQSGDMPPGLTLNSNGTITGKPTDPGTYNFVAKVDDSGPPAQSTSQAFQIAVNPALAITTTSLPGGATGSSYSQPVNAAGGIAPYSWSITQGNLPTGLNLDASTGVISGTPTAAGTSNFTIKVTDSQSPTDSDTKQLSIGVAPPLFLAFQTAPTGVVGQPISNFVPLSATGGTPPYGFSISAGTMPPGIGLNTASGEISGTPTQAGSFDFTVLLTDAGAQTATRATSITVVPALDITTTTVPDGEIPLAGSFCTFFNQPPCYSTTLSGTGGGGPPYVWAVTQGSLPPGLALNESTGAISGNPTTAGTFAFTVALSKIGSPALPATRTLLLTIFPSPPSINPELPFNATFLQSFSTGALSVTGGFAPFTWSVSAGQLPDGLTMNSATGEISGTPTAVGTFGFTVRAAETSNPFRSSTRNMSIQVLPPVTIGTKLPTAFLNTSYDATLSASGGVSPYSWAVVAGSLPPGLTLNTVTGAITGAPTSAGTDSCGGLPDFKNCFTFTVQATDFSIPVARTATKELKIAVTSSPPPSAGVASITSGDPPRGIVNQSYSFTLTATGPTPYTWSVAGLPPGLTVNSSTGVISGTPVDYGLFPIRVTLVAPNNVILAAYDLRVDSSLCVLCGLF